MNESDFGLSELDRVLAVAYRKSDSLPHELGASPKLRRFENVQPLGTGGMGEVFSARDRVLERRVALKVIRRNLRLSDEVRARFLREARVLSNIEHPNVCVLYDYIQSASDDVLVLELIDGETLQRRLDSGVERSKALLIAEGIAAALTAAHGAGIVHRDLKPANVMITPEGVPKVLDFGIAHAGDDRSWSRDSGVSDEGTDVTPPLDEVTSRGQVLGTPAYMSPEQRSGEAASPASDIYSFGLVLQEMLGPTMLTHAMRDEDPRNRPTAAEVQHSLRRIIDRPRRRALQAIALATIVAFSLLGTRYVVDVQRERDHALDRQARAERLIAFLVERVASRIEDVGPRSLIEAVDEEAIRYFRGEPGTPFSEVELRQRVQALSGYARRIRAYGRLATAKAIYKEVEGFLVELPRSQLNSPEWSFELGQVRFYLGEIARDEGLHAETLDYWSSYAAISGRLASREPGNLVFLDELAYAQTNLGVFQLENGNPLLAQPEFGKALAHWKQRATENPDDVDLHLEWADALSWHAESLSATGDVSGASQAFASEVEIRESLGALDPANGTLAHGLVLAYHHLGRALSRAGDPEASVRTLRKAQDAITSLASLDRQHAQWKRTQALVANTLGLLLDDRSRFEEAWKAHQEAQVTIEELLERDPTNGDWVSLSAHVVLAAAQNRHLAGYPDIARRLLQETVRRIESDRGLIKGLNALEIEISMLQADLNGGQQELCTRALELLASTSFRSPADSEDIRLRLLLRLRRIEEAAEIFHRLRAREGLSGAADRDWAQLGPQPPRLVDDVEKRR